MTPQSVDFLAKIKVLQSIKGKFKRMPSTRWRISHCCLSKCSSHHQLFLPDIPPNRYWCSASYGSCTMIVVNYSLLLWYIWFWMLKKKILIAKTLTRQMIRRTQTFKLFWVQAKAWGVKLARIQQHTLILTVQPSQRKLQELAPKFVQALTCPCFAVHSPLQTSTPPSLGALARGAKRQTPSWSQSHPNQRDTQTENSSSHHLEKKTK